MTRLGLKRPWALAAVLSGSLVFGMGATAARASESVSVSPRAAAPGSPAPAPVVGETPDVSRYLASHGGVIDAATYVALTGGTPAGAAAPLGGETKIRHIDCQSAQFYWAYDPHADVFSHPIPGGVMTYGQAVHVRSTDERLGPRGLIVLEFGGWAFVSRNCVTGYH